MPEEHPVLVSRDRRRAGRGTDRRGFLRLLAGGAALAGCSHHHAPLTCEQTTPGHEIPRLPDFDREVLTFGPLTDRTVVLLHELPGMYPSTLGLARCLARQGMTVYLPLLFGTVEQESGFLGYFQACWSRDFSCGKTDTTSEGVKQVSTLCDEARKRSGQSVGVIGMCLTGAFPLALLGNNANVTAAVLCQPALPFSALRGRPTKKQAKDLGISAADARAARESRVPFLALRFLDDDISPERRMQALEERFQEQIATIRLQGTHDDDHSTLAGSFDPVAFEDTVAYVKVRLGLEAGPTEMKLAKLNGASCLIGADGRWHAKR